ncbi:hypothetical protein GIB67_028470 [Kingdonia uniflora]|uniref:Uncharacterized protein n=1 Tax=Kingdonia uniflora TaxID=39325 RepID=A0A7J7P1R2_9MAGN|nr:hypothetical protein GIB67_028470 [Kingdonia uniflora]
MASGLETLCGQAYGAHQYRKVGIHTYSAIISLILVCFPLSLIWISLGKLLTAVGQDPLISNAAGKYAMWTIPGLFASAILQPLMKYLQSQSLILPMLISSTVTLCLHVPLCWVLVFKCGFGTVGAALATSISFWLNTIVLGLYVKYSPSCERTRVPLSKEAFQGIRSFLRLALPSAVMICLEWWSFELLVLLSGLLPNAQLETSVLSICLTTISFLYTIPLGLGAAASTRVSNELGARKPQAARVAAYTIMLLALSETILMSTTLFACRYILGYAFSNEKEVVDYVTRMTPLICISVITDSLQGVLSGVARGCGWQHLGAYVNLGAYYLGGIPIAVLLGFYYHWGGRGLWIGILTGSSVQTIFLFLITGSTNWQNQVSNARERILDRRLPLENDLK